MPPQHAAQLIAGWSADRASIELLAVDPTESAKIINRLPTPFAGQVLSAVAARQPVRARKILEIVMPDRAGLLLDHMSAPAAAGALALAPATGSVDLLAEADTLTTVGALTGMPADRAAPLVQAMGETRAVEVLRMMPDPAAVAGILSHVVPAAGRQALLIMLPVPFRALVIKHLQATSGVGDRGTLLWQEP
jgi:Mg/Co/Ni transporter MgtE